LTSGQNIGIIRWISQLIYGEKMLGKIRNQAGSLFFKIFLSVIALSFVLWGVGEFATGSFNTTAITVNGTGIPVQKVDRTYRSSVNRTENRLGGELTDEQRKVLRIGEMTIGSLIRETLLTDYAEKMGIRISDEQLNSVLRGMSAFHNAEGKFDPDIYRNTLRDQHDMTVEGFEKLITNQLSRVALNSLFGVPALRNKEILENIVKMNREELTINALTLTPEDISDVEKPTVDQQRAYYQETRDRWKTLETRSFDVLTISAEQLSKGINITDAEAKTYYEDNKDSFNVPEKRQAQHILLETSAKARELLEEIKGGADFGALAKEHSLDKFSGKSGGDLGQFAANDMVEPFSKAAFALKKGAVSDVVESPFGFHIIKLNETFPSYLESFDDVKERIKEQLAFNKAEEQYAELIEQIEDRIAGGDSLQKIGSDLKLPVTAYADKTRWDGMVDTSILSPEESTATRAAFTVPSKGEISDKISLSNTSGIYVGVTDIKTPVQQSFEEVRETVEKDMVHEATLKLLGRKAAGIYNANKAGKSLKEIADIEKIKSYTTIEGIDRRLNNAPEWFSGPQASQLFDDPSAERLAAPIPHKDGYVIVELAKRTVPEITDEMLRQDHALLTSAIGDDLRMQYLKYLYHNADISLNTRLLGQVMPNEEISEDMLVR
jgi:peptidyl-prolyl cis-trans isomerase D